MAAPKTKHRPPISPADLFEFQVPGGVSVSPDGKHVAYSLEQMHEEDDDYRAHVHVLNLDSDEVRSYGNGRRRDGAPAWSPDGERLAYVSAREKKLGIYVTPVAGGAEECLLQVDGSVASLQWSPDGASLVFSLQYTDRHFIEDEEKKKKPPVFRHITRLDYKLDGAGWTPQKPRHIYRCDIETLELTALTSGKADCSDPHLSPDGRWMVYVSNRHRQADLHPEHLDLFVRSTKAGAKERRLRAPVGPKYVPRFSPDSASIAYLGHTRPDEPWGVPNLHVWKLGLRGKSAARDLMPRFDRSVVDYSLGDVGASLVGGELRWSPSGGKIFFIACDTGSSRIFSIAARGATPVAVVGQRAHVKGFDLARGGKDVVYVRADPKTPGEIYSAPAGADMDASARRHSDYSKFLRGERALAKVKEIWFRADDGERLQGWLYLPAKPKRKKLPAILEIHGGPATQYAHSFMHEFHFLAGQGDAVLGINPRGSLGRGEDFCAATIGYWGTRDYEDCMQAADWLESQDFVDAKRMGVTGGSFGGYMTNWMIGHTRRFKAAVTQRSVSDLSSMVGSSDIGHLWGQEFKGWPWTERERYERYSPMNYVKNIRTPLLILHSEEDLRCHLEQAEQLFTQLRVLGRKAEMVLFPAESHGLSRGGTPSRRIARLEWIRSWFERYLAK